MELELTEEQKKALKAELCSGEKPSSDVRIVILQRGWVMVGRYSQNGDECSLTDCSTIRAWGTTKGLEARQAAHGAISPSHHDRHH